MLLIDMKNLYIYAICDKKGIEVYIGKRISNKEPEIDTYMGSGKILLGYVKNGYHHRGIYEINGKENYSKIILTKNISTLQQLNDLEKFWISYYKFLGKAQYNIADGGDGGRLVEVNPMQGKNHSIETRKKISEKKKLFYKNNPNKKLIGDKNPMFGIPMTEQAKQKARQKLKITSSGENNGMYGKLWFNNGLINVAAKICPDGFIPGLLPFSKEHKQNISTAKKEKHRHCSAEDKEKKRQAMIGFHWWTDGQNDIYSKQCPEGYRKGKSIMKVNLK